MISRRRGHRGMRDLQAHERFTYEAVEELLLLPIRATNIMNVLPPKNYWTMKKASWVAGGPNRLTKSVIEFAVAKNGKIEFLSGSNMTTLS